MYSSFSLVFEIDPVGRFDYLGKLRGKDGAAPRVIQSGDSDIVASERTLINRRMEAVLSGATQNLLSSRRENPIKAYYQKQRYHG